MDTVIAAPDQIMDTVIAAPDQIEAMDKYTASIELSNACREFYKSRVEAAQCIKSRWEKETHTQRFTTTTTTTTTAKTTPSNDNDRPADDNCRSKSTHKRQTRSSIDQAMDKLRAEMSSLMDQDLSLMKQLLTLNETIEDLKWQRRYYYNSPPSSTELDHSDCSISDTEMYAESDDDLVCHTSPATTTAPTTCPSLSSSASHRKHSTTSAHAFSTSDKRCLDSELLKNDSSSVKVYHSEQDSFDSGIHESCHDEVASV